MSTQLLMGQGKRSASIMFVLDRPSMKQFKNRSYLYGKEMAILLDSLDELGIDYENECYFTAVVKISTPDDREPIKKEIDEYKDYLQAEISVIDPDIIVPLDNNALKQTYGLTNITKFRGKSVEKELYGRKRIIFPTINPELIFKQPKYAALFVKDMENIAEIWENGSDSLQSSEVQYRSLETYEEVKAEIDRFMEESEWLVFDLETTGLDPFKPGQQIVCISLTDRDHYGVTIPLNHPQFKWPKGIFEKIIFWIKKLLENKKFKKMAHNGKFDIKWLKYKYDIDVANFVFDPMIAHYLAVSEEASHGLKDLAWEYSDMGGYDNKLDQFKQENHIIGNYSQIDWDILKVYAAADVDCTFRIYKALHPLLDENQKWLNVFNNNLMPASYTFRDMEINGMKLDHDLVHKYQEVYPKHMQEVEEDLRNYPEIVEIEREKNELFALRQLEMKKPKEERSQKILKYNKYKNFKFKFSSPNQVRELLFVKLGLTTPFLTKKGEKRKRAFIRKETRKNRKSHKLSHDEIEALFKPELDELSTGKETMAYLADKHPMTKAIAEWKKLSKAYSSYVKPALTWEGEDGLIHPEYLLTGTVTGRLASEKPNAQNFTKPSENPHDFDYKYPIKRMFVSRFGKEGVLLQFDYSQQELRVLGIVSGDKNMVAAFMSGKDIHSKTASTMYHKSIDQVTSHERRNAKKVNFGIPYGKGDASLSRDMGMTLEEGKKFLDDYFRTYPDIKKWRDYDQDFVQEHEYIESITGRYRRLPGVHSSEWSIRSHCQREALNFPIQSASADITMKANNLINKKFHKKNLKSVLCMTVHDSIVADVYLPEFNDVFNIMQQTMEHLPFKWLGDMPMKAEAEVGRNYADTVGISSPDDLQGYESIFDYIDEKLEEKYQDDLNKANKNIELENEKKKQQKTE